MGVKTYKGRPDAIELAQRGNHLTRLRDVLAELRPLPLFDYILLDCPPSLGVIMTSALAAADEVLVSGSNTLPAACCIKR